MWSYLTPAGYEFDRFEYSLSEIAFTQDSAFLRNFFSFICLLFYRFFSTHPFVKTRSTIAIHPIPGYYDLNKLSDDTLINKLQFFWPTVF